MYITVKSITVTLFLLLAILLPAPGQGQELASGREVPWPTQAPWSSLSLSGAKLGTTLTVSMRLGPAAEMAKLQPWAGLPQTAACSTPPDQAAMLSTTLTVKGMLRNSRYSEALWFDQTGSPQKRLRYNQERGDYWLKGYCWEKNGVQRSKLVPADEDASSQKPSARAEQSSSWYPLPPHPAQCISVSDPALLIVLASALAKEPQHHSLTLCTFGRQHLFLVEMVREIGATQAVSYRILQNNQPAQERSSRIQPLVYRVSAQNVQPASQAEKFSLMGLEEDIRILVDPATHLPIRVSGKAKLAGKVELELREARLN